MEIYIESVPGRVQRPADVVIKVEENLPVLRDREQREPRNARPSRREVLA